MIKNEIIKLFKVLLFLFLFSINIYALSYENKISTISICGGINSSDIFNNNDISGEVLNIYRATVGFEVSLRSFKIKEKFRKIKLKFTLLTGGFDNHLINQSIKYEVKKKYRINYLKFSLLNPVIKYKSRINIVSGIYLGLPLSGDYKLFKNSFISNIDSKKINSSWLKTDFGLNHILKYNINNHVIGEIFIYHGLKNSFNNKKEYYKTVNKMIGLGISYLI